MLEQVPDDVVGALKKAKHVVALTGAGVSAESGVPTFRDAMKGLWAKYNPMKLATPEAFERDPEMVSRWYDQRRQDCALVKPNPGHYALARMENSLLERGGAFSLLTQNVDRLHQQAGSRNVVELHGSILEWRCMKCGMKREERGGAFKEYPPRCECGGMRRPDVVWFGEQLLEEAIAAAERALVRCDLFFSIGTSAVVQPSASFIHVARGHGAKTVEINSESTPISGIVDWSIVGKSGEILPELVEKAFKANPKSQQESEQYSR
ncbi:MAG: NAD-dependent deacylase [Candidatus Aureabacteria bacterium]|nr:NAD-dependent deacylase [Candidatus Auribacterota bacterium]